ncbi:uncharacterized protein LOC116294628 isoform X2 [Actinia tenebrosa]|uniref:Uncharacterized protein LOC116294628 isoform X2 n=1 Tax=Actinia tenebrosa TaxID=6105 RepID=A0A6P8HZU3_ACTTE|nr:uncharacterized protein LOC116294628 isoform X2 [Actinia tenebrosa]
MLPQRDPSNHQHSADRLFSSTPESSKTTPPDRKTGNRSTLCDWVEQKELPNTSKIQNKQMKRDIKLLQEENEELKAELTYIKSLYKQLIEELPNERFDERRVNLLKSQVIQLERQVTLQSWALNLRTDVLIEIEGQLLNVIDCLRSMQTPDVTTYSKISDLLCTVEGIRHYLSKTIEPTNPETLALPAVFMGKFLKCDKKMSSNHQTTLIDMCSGKFDHLNLRHVSKLESKLCKLYKQMVCLKEVLQEKCITSVTGSDHIGQPIRDHMNAHVQATTTLLEDSCQDLLSLSVLIPSAPWPPLNKQIRPDLNLENVMSHMPSSLSRKKEEEIRSVIDPLMKAVSYDQHMHLIEIKILKEELSFHQRMYQLQLDYTESVLSSIRTAYTEFEKSTSEMLCEPLERILEYYEALRTTTSEEDLRLFLTAFKDNAEKISDAVECLQSHRNKDSAGSIALSEYCQNFLDKLNSLIKECAIKRDTLMKKLIDLKKQESEDQLMKKQEGN